MAFKIICTQQQYIEHIRVFFDDSEQSANNVTFGRRLNSKDLPKFSSKALNVMSLDKSMNEYGIVDKKIFRDYYPKNSDYY